MPPSPRPVRTTEGRPPRSSAQRRISAWSVVVVAWLMVDLPRRYVAQRARFCLRSLARPLLEAPRCAAAHALAWRGAAYLGCGGRHCVWRRGGADVTRRARRLRLRVAAESVAPDAAYFRPNCMRRNAAGFVPAARAAYAGRRAGDFHRADADLVPRGAQS